MAIRAKLDFKNYYRETDEAEWENVAQAEKAIASIQRAIDAAKKGKKPKKKQPRIDVKMLHKIRKIVEKNPRITYRELAEITKKVESTLRNNKNVRAIFNSDIDSRKREAKKRYTDATPD